jgi:hypothetical protein
MKKSYKNPSPELLEALMQARDMEKENEQGQSANIVLAELKLACAK